MKKTMQIMAVLVVVLALTAISAIAQTAPAVSGEHFGPVYAGQAQVQADMIFSLGGGVAVCWAIANLKNLKLFKNLQGAGTVAVSIVISYALTGLVLFAEGSLKIPKLLLIGAIVAKMANGYYNNSNHTATSAAPATPAK
jgi:hypothetical protein